VARQADDHATDDQRDDECKGNAEHGDKTTPMLRGGMVNNDVDD
jgi:hypothetical protein